MPLVIGDSLGPYQILAPIGAGGMGEVYRARDTKLNRDVALKILPAEFALDADRLARFKREAQVLASLNHPNIAAIYGFEDSDGTPALVLELVEGPTVADRIAEISQTSERESLRSSARNSEARPARGGGAPRGLAMEDALPIARQIADALEVAHEQGIVHRDLKPANVKLRADGTVKVLDFGLAKMLEPAEAGGPGAVGSARIATLTNSPTITTPAMTRLGVILGSAAYMSPEQARGRPVDRRTDIWSFGCVLFEMLAGKRAFDGDDVTETIAAVVKSEPDWQSLPPSVSGQVRLLLQKCLEKDPRARISEIGTVRFLLTETVPVPESPRGGGTDLDRRVEATSQRLRRIAIGASALLVAIVLGALATWTFMRSRERASQTLRFTITPPPGFTLSTITSFAISPDGSRIVFPAVGEDGQTQLVLRTIGNLEPHVLAETGGASFPFMSPDGRWIGFFARNELKKIPIAGGTSTTLCRLNGNPRGASWGSDDTIIFATADPATGLLSVPAAGGDPRVLTNPDVKRAEDHWFPSFLPNARAVLYTIIPVDRPTSENRQVAILDLGTGQSKVLIRGAANAKYAESGHLVYTAAGALLAVPFDVSTLEVHGDPTPEVERVMTEGTFALAPFAISSTGTLVYVPGGPGSPTSRSLVWVNRQGQEQAIEAPVRAYTLLRLSPDGTRVALDIRDQQNDIWIWDFARHTLAPLTFDPATDRNPVWTPDGSRIIFTSTRDGAFNLYWQAADGTGSAERLTTITPGASFQLPMAVSSDGIRMVINMNGDIGLLTLKGADVPAPPLNETGQRESHPMPGPTVNDQAQSPKPLFRTPVTEDNAELSPDGRWLAYQSIESGVPQIYVRPFPNVNDGRWQVSTNSGVKPAWARNGRELFYVAPGSAFMAVPISPSTITFVAGNPVKLFNAPYYFSVPNRTYDVSPDGQRFLMIKENASSDRASSISPGIVVVLNWSEELKQRVPGR